VAFQRHVKNLDFFLFLQQNLISLMLGILLYYLHLQIVLVQKHSGIRGGAVGFEALRYKSEGRGFDS